MRRLVHVPCMVVLFCGLLLSPAAGAELQVVASDPDSEALAYEAHQVHEEHCAQAAGAAITRAAESVAAVSDVWARVSAREEASGQTYLLYWRGVLAQCLDQEERAVVDLEAFVEGQKGRGLWASLVADAEQRLRQLASKMEAGEGTSAVALLPGVGLSLGAGVFGVGAAVAWQQSRQVAVDKVYPDDRDGAALAAAIEEGETLARLSGVLTGVAVGCGVGAVVSFVVAGTQSSRGRRAALRVPVVVPGPKGAVVLWEGRW